LYWLVEDFLINGMKCKIWNFCNCKWHAFLYHPQDTTNNLHQLTKTHQGWDIYGLKVLLCSRS
jgi:hypothetical protein